MLAERFASEVSQVLIPQQGYRPFPSASDRSAWASLPEEVRQACIAAGERHLARDWPALPATLFMDYARTGNRSRFEASHFERRRALAPLVLAECVEGSGRFVDDII